MEITVFGGGTIPQEEYDEAVNLGRRIASKNHILKNGGYGGVMEATAKGCSEKGGRSIGIAIKEHKIATAGKPNPHLSEVIEKETLNERIKELLNTDIIIIMKGSIGTLEEFLIAWAENIVKGKHSEKTTPIYIVGEKNKRLIKFLIENGFVNEEYLPYITQVDSINEIKELI